MLTINVTLTEFHSAIQLRLQVLEVDHAKVVAAVNEELTDVAVDESKSSTKLGFTSTKGTPTKAPMMTVKSTDKRVSVKTKVTNGLRLAEIHEYLCKSAELYTRIEAITLPQSIETWLSADRFKLAAQPQPAENTPQGATP